MLVMFPHRHSTSEVVPINTDRSAYLGENLKVYEGLDVLNEGEQTPRVVPTRSL
jgi:hypothetical protein